MTKSENTLTLIKNADFFISQHYCAEWYEFGNLAVDGYTFF